MRFDVITLFPELFAPLLSHGINRRAFESGLVDVRLWQLRDFAEGNYRRVDDRPFGGGPGMVMLADPLYRCWQAIRAERNEANPAPTVLFSPLGQHLAHPVVERYAQGAGAILVCGRYEGIDQRFIDACVDVQLSLGDFVLSGGEIPAMALLDCGGTFATRRAQRRGQPPARQLQSGIGWFAGLSALHPPRSLARPAR